jgi:hypothetical protein
LPSKKDRLGLRSAPRGQTARSATRAATRYGTLDAGRRGERSVSVLRPNSEAGGRRQVEWKGASHCRAAGLMLSVSTMWRIVMMLCLAHECSSFSKSHFGPSLSPTTNDGGALSKCRQLGRGRHQTLCVALRMLWADSSQGQGGEEEEKKGIRKQGSPPSSSLAEGLLGKVRESHQRQASVTGGAGLLDALSGDSRHNLLEQIMTTTDEDKKAVGELEQLVSSIER